MGCSRMRDLGLEAGIAVKTDASAACAIWHLEVRELWVQDNVARKEVRMKKVASKGNSTP